MSVHCIFSSSVCVRNTAEQMVNNGALQLVRATWALSTNFINIWFLLLLLSQKLTLPSTSMVLFDRWTIYVGLPEKIRFQQIFWCVPNWPYLHEAAKLHAILFRSTAINHTVTHAHPHTDTNGTPAKQFVAYKTIIEKIDGTGGAEYKQKRNAGKVFRYESKTTMSHVI